MPNLTHNRARVLRLILLIIVAAVTVVIVAGCGHGGGY
jgi:hypothetical protein